jgi:thiamine pyrophosphate-dependent acetolactate synthase large subunit-like protein
MVSFPAAPQERPVARKLSRLDLTRRLVATLARDEVVVGGIGNTKFDLVAAGPRPQNFYMLGSMGLAVSIGLGVALAQPDRRVIALEGDGSLLMNLGCLATVAQLAPPNLTIVIWDNGVYQITGNQRTATAAGTDTVALARGAGIYRAAWADDAEAFESLAAQALGAPGPALIAARVDDSPGLGRPDWDPVVLKDRFMRGIGTKA